MDVGKQGQIKIKLKERDRLMVVKEKKTLKVKQGGQREEEIVGSLEES